MGPAHGHPAGRKARILVVEDNDEALSILADVLRRDGHHVELATEGRQALAAQEQSPFDVLITDVFMPDADGVETVRAFHRNYPQTRVIAMSGHSGTKVDYLSLCLEVGADRVLRKPFDLEALQTALEEVLAQQSQ